MLHVLFMLFVCTQPSVDYLLDEQYPSMDPRYANRIDVPFWHVETCGRAVTPPPAFELALVESYGQLSDTFESIEVVHAESGMVVYASDPVSWTEEFEGRSALIRFRRIVNTVPSGTIVLRFRFAPMVRRQEGALDIYYPYGPPHHMVWQADATLFVEPMAPDSPINNEDGEEPELDRVD